MNLISLDFDNTLFDTAIPFLRFLNVKFGKDFPLGFVSYPKVAEMFGLDDTNWNENVYEFLFSSFYLESKPLAEFSLLQEIAKSYALIVNTGRPEQWHWSTLLLCQISYPQLISDYFYHGDLANNRSLSQKYQLCLSKKVVCHVDDDYGHAFDCAIRGIPSIWLTKEQTVSRVPNLRVATNWRQVAFTIEEISLQNIALGRS